MNHKKARTRRASSFHAPTVIIELERHRLDAHKIFLGTGYENSQGQAMKIPFAS